MPSVGLPSVVPDQYRHDDVMAKQLQTDQLSGNGNRCLVHQVRTRMRRRGLQDDTLPPLRSTLLRHHLRRDGGELDGPAFDPTQTGKAEGARGKRDPVFAYARALAVDQPAY